jgi:hypothetical protein
MQRYNFLILVVLAQLVVPKRVVGQQDLCSITALDSDKLYAIEEYEYYFNFPIANSQYF